MNELHYVFSLNPLNLFGFRWVNSLDPSLNWNPWTEEEDLKLNAAISEHGYCWSMVASCVPGRTDNQCWR